MVESEVLPAGRAADRAPPQTASRNANRPRIAAGPTLWTVLASRQLIEHLMMAQDAPPRSETFPNTRAAERLLLGVGCAFSGSPRRYVVQGAASLDDHVDCVVVRPDPDHVAVRVDDGADRRRLRG